MPSHFAYTMNNVNRYQTTGCLVLGGYQLVGIATVVYRMIEAWPHLTLMNSVIQIAIVLFQGELWPLYWLSRWLF